MRSNDSKGFRLICESCRGGRQGNPLTNLAFPLIINKALKDVEAKFPRVEVKAYQDNITLIGPIQDLFKAKDSENTDDICAFDLLTQNLRNIGSTVHPEKSQLFTLATDDIVDKYVPSECKLPFLLDCDGKKTLWVRKLRCTHRLH